MNLDMNETHELLQKDDKNFFRELRKKLLADLIVKQMHELTKLGHLYYGGLLKDGRDFWILRAKIRKNKETLRALSSEDAPSQGT